MTSGQSLNVTNKFQLEYALKYITELYEKHGYVHIVPTTDKPRTKQQNNALHKYCTMLAEELNDKGLDMRKVLKPEIPIPWTKDSVKRELWAKIQVAMFDKESTAQASTAEPAQIYDTLNRHLGTRFGVYVPWPSKETMEVRG